MYDECYCDDDRDMEQDIASAADRGQFHQVTMDVTVRITVLALGSTHEADDLEDMVTETALSEGEILNIEEV
jgi:hypothetical protein